MAPSDAAWERLGELLTQRRAQLDPRYGKRTVFTRERHLDYRIAYEVERHRRHNFGDGMLAAIEAAYALVPGSLKRTLDGAPLEAVAPPAVATDGNVRNGQLSAPPAEVTISLETVRAIVGPAVMDTASAIRRHAEAVLARNPDATGSDVFPGEPDLAGMWDLAPDLSIYERSRYAAIMRLGRGQRKSGLRGQRGASA